MVAALHADTEEGDFTIAAQQAEGLRVGHGASVAERFRARAKEAGHNADTHGNDI